MALIRTNGGAGSSNAVKFFCVGSGNAITLDAGNYYIYVDNALSPNYVGGWISSCTIADTAGTRTVGVSGTGVSILSAGTIISTYDGTEHDFEDVAGEISVANNNTSVTFTKPTDETGAYAGNMNVILVKA